MQALFRGVTNTSRTVLYVKITGYTNNFIHTKRRQVRGEKRKQIAERLENKSAFQVLG